MSNDLQKMHSRVLGKFCLSLQFQVSDVRFSIRRGSHEDWILDLLHVKSTDEARYECQVSTEPPQIHKIYLTVEGKIQRA